MRDLLYPRTDGGALIQVVLVAVTWAIALVGLRRRHELALFVSGLAMVALGWFGFRAIH